MASRIEQQIDEITQYIDSCKYAAFSSDKILVDRDKLLDMLSDLRGNMPEEMARYRKVVNERRQILDDARAKAQALIDETTAKTNQLVNDQEIMQQAYAQANEVVAMSSQRAQQIEDDAVADANNYRLAAVQYMEQMLAKMEEFSRRAAQETDAAYSRYADELRRTIKTISSNRAELQRSEARQTAAASAGNGAAGAATADIQSQESGVPESGTGTIRDSSGQGTDDLALDGAGSR
ncbi:MAG: hypothetical protein LKG90_01540 [Lachnospiraceae bacterium]|jgi:vacuolar-type H+-ATPase subunit H|nr:hypothetical protein [Lachnospiraceae bacterium]MCH4027513.1 hypothetical protein [Lachnospiraceae bacterium]MCH4065353.1 hypothetical protein [Lachnospiraceae bacterium]MCH4111393.1 hypothetical protein [Lachnospiraceae bacterium]MCI1352530.1 hypothetical protein [Lachnospiraceae bacterium]